jgi:hypothetical protein
MQIFKKLGHFLIVFLIYGGLAFFSKAAFLSPNIQTPYKTEGIIRINSLKPLKTNLSKYEIAEFILDINATFNNPFDPDDINVEADIITPDNKTIKLPGFYYQDFSRNLVNNHEILSPASKGDWRFRFTPKKSGDYKLIAYVQDRNGKVKSDPIPFKVLDNSRDGFVHISKRNKRFFEFESGRAFYLTGANTCWAGSRGTFDYDEWFKRFSENGCNYGRLWLSPHWTTFALERPGKPEEGKGLGLFDLANAWRIDYVLQLAEKHGIFLKLCIDSYNILRKKDAYPEWERTPHNVKNGGILNEPTEFWTDSRMEKLYKNKLRYLVARYGAYANLFAWEFWNEVDITTGYNREVVRDWHQKMAKYLQEIDPYNHLITTSFAGSGGEPIIDLLPEIDYVQTHHYGSPDLVTTIEKYHKLKTSYGKPHYIGEIGADAGGPRGKDDPLGCQVHDPMWISIALGCAGVAQSWWWDNLIYPNNLYHLYKPVSEFVKNIDFPGEDFKQFNFQIHWQVPPVPPQRYDLVFEGGPVSWGESEYNKPRVVVINRNGVVSGAPIAGILHGTVNHPTLHNPVTFETTLPWETALEINVGGVSGYGGASLEVFLNNKLVLEKQFIDDDNSTETLTKYAGTYKVTIPAGKNKIVVKNTGKDWIMVDFKFKNAIEKNTPPLLSRGIIGNKTAIVWLRNELATWHNICVKKLKLEPVKPTFLTSEQLKPGKYKVEIWNTWDKGDVKIDTIQVQPGKDIKILLPEIEHDLAIKLIHID